MIETCFFERRSKRYVERDRYNNELLLEQGWPVLRFWESNVKKDLGKCVDEVLRYL